MQQTLSSGKFLVKNKILYLTFFFFLVAALFALDDFTLIKRIEVISKAKKIKGLQMYFERSLPLLNIAQTKAHLLKLNPQIKEINVEKKYPNRLIIFIKLQEPLASISVNQGQFILSEDGTILEKSSKVKENLPSIKYYQKLNYSFYDTGDKVNYKDVLTALHFAQTVKNLGLKVDSVDINGLNVIALNLNSRKIIFTTEKEISLQDYQLRTIIRQFKIEGKEFKLLDLRFDRPILKF